MSINCSEKCIHEIDGICSLNHIVNSTGINYNNCPYFSFKEKYKTNKKSNLKLK